MFCDVVVFSCSGVFCHNFEVFFCISLFCLIILVFWGNMLFLLLSGRLDSRTSYFGAEIILESA